MNSTLIEMFEDLAEKMDINLVQGKGNFKGGLCSLNMETYLVLNKSKPLEQRLRILAVEFGQLDLSVVYIVPVLRSYIEEISHSLFQGNVA